MRELFRVDRSKVATLPAVRGALVVVVVLAIAVATGQTLTGLVVAIGVVNVAASDQSGPYRERAERLVVAAVAAGVSVFVGAATGANDTLAVVLAAVWGLVGGLVVALGPAATVTAVPSITLLLVFGAMPATLRQSAAEGGLVLLSGLMYAAVAVGAWPVRPFGPQRSALAAVFHSLAGSARESVAVTGPPAATAEMMTAAAALAATSRDDGETEALRIVFDQAERLCLELLALDTLRQDLDVDAPARIPLQAVLQAAGEVLEAIAGSLSTRHATPGVDVPLRRLDLAVNGLQLVSAGNTQATVALKHVQALAGQLRTVVQLGAAGKTVGAGALDGSDRASPFTQRVGDAVAMLRANLTLQSPAGRHAVRMAGCLVVADALGRMLQLPRAYWLPLTVAIVLRPDFAATFSRGVSRIAGTLVGLLLTTGLVVVLGDNLPGHVVLVGVLTFVFLCLSAANLALSAAAVSSLVVLLLSITGVQPDATIVERGVNTLLGGGLALIVYLVWPTWERPATPGVLAEMLEAYRRYFDAVMTTALEPSAASPSLIASLRRAARQARTNAEASIVRLRADPSLDRKTAARELDTAEGVLANSHRFLLSVMSLEAALYQDAAESPRTPPPSLRAFVEDVDVTLRATVQALRDSVYEMDNLPDLRAEERELAHIADPGNGALAALVLRADPIVNSLNTIVTLLQNRQAIPRVYSGRHEVATQARRVVQPCSDFSSDVRGE